jgi:hypothetical protein
MKRTLTRITIALALIAVASPMLSAQSLRAEIPFNFRAGAQMLPAGTYLVNFAGTAGQVVVITRAETGSAVFVLPSGTTSGRDISTGEPGLTFECGESRCALIRLWTGSGASALTFRTAPQMREAHAFLAKIRLTISN